MMNWYGGGMGGGAWLFMGLLWLALIGLIVWLVVRLLPGSKPDNDTRESAEEILDRRFAMGEIDVDTYKAQRSALVAAQAGRR
jgi:putative membrane protein